MTGQSAHTRFVPGIGWRMSPAERTLADEFNEAGYHTIFIGKWHLYGMLGSHLPGFSAYEDNRRPVPRSHQGRWQRWLGFELRHSHYDTCYFEDDIPEPHLLNGYQTDQLTNLAIDELTKTHEKPFCCVLSVEPPHPPLEAPEEDMVRWRDRSIQLPPNIEPYEDPRWRPGDAEYNRRIYYAMIENLDRNIGRLLNTLQYTGLADTTSVILVSDHGELEGAHGYFGKQRPYEESIGIPFIVHDPRFPENHGSVVDMPLRTEDLFPTICEIAGIAPRNELPGNSFAPAVRGESPPQRKAVLLQAVGEFRQNVQNHNGPWRAIRGRRYTYAVRRNREHGGLPWLLFDNVEDRWQMKNLLEDPSYQNVARHQHELLLSLLQANCDDYTVEPAFGLSGHAIVKEPNRRSSQTESK